MASWSVAVVANPPVGGKYVISVGDIVSYKPINKQDTWTTIEHKNYFIVQITGLTEREVHALCTGSPEDNYKRRFVFQESDMTNKGIDVAKLKNPDLVYKKPIILNRNDIFDKKLGRHISNDDILNQMDKL